MYSAIAANKRNTVIIMILFIAVITGLGWIFSEVYGSTGIFWGTMVGAGIYALIQYYVRRQDSTCGEWCEADREKGQPVAL